jgi:hypothetical protein
MLSDLKSDLHYFWFDISQFFSVWLKSRVGVTALWSWEGYAQSCGYIGSQEASSSNEKEVQGSFREEAGWREWTSAQAQWGMFSSESSNGQ